MSANRFLRCIAVSALLLLIPVQPWAAQPKSIAVMDFELLDDTAQYNTPEVNEAQNRRVRLITEELKREFVERGLYNVLDNSIATERIEAVKESQEFYNCNGCELEIGKAMNAELILTGWVQKVSNLILNINVEVKEVGSGMIVYRKSVDIRGNTDTSWLRGIKYLVDSIVEKRQHLK